MAGDVGGDVTRLGPDLRTGQYVVAIDGPLKTAKFHAHELKDCHGQFPAKLAGHGRLKGRKKHPIRTWKRSTPATVTTSSPMVVTPLKVDPDRSSLPVGSHVLVVSPTVGAVAEAPANVQEYTKQLLAQLELKLKSRLSSIDAADIDLAVLGSVADLADTMMSQLPASHPFDETIGPFYDANGAANRMHVAPETMQDKARNNELLACPTAEGDVVFPTFQFNPDGTALPGLERVLTALAVGTQDRWQVALWLTTPNDELKGRTPREALNEGASAAVQKIAEQTADRWCH